jgi:hypothetical protein
MGALFFEVIRVFYPGYDERMTKLCTSSRNALVRAFSSAFKDIHAANNNIFPFMKGEFVAALYGDTGDDRLLMNGRVNDFGSYRAEKELDTCPWDILGSEICRISPCAQEGMGTCYTGGGPSGEFCMVEARGCGDPKCRLIFENREKYPLPSPREKNWESFGPAATMDQIKVTPEADRLSEPQQFREESNFFYRSGLDCEFTAAEYYTFGGPTLPLGTNYVTSCLEDLIAAGELKKEEVYNVIECVFEGGGKMAYSDFFAVKGLRDWLGVPNDVNDGRVLGGLIEILLQILMASYTVVAFNKDEVVYDIDLAGLERRTPMLTHAYLAMWYGMVKTLVSPLWFVWRETEGVPDATLRLKIAKKIDKFCR